MTDVISPTIDKKPRKMVRDPETASLVPATNGVKGPVFTVRSLDYYDVQHVYTGADVREQTKIAFERGLLAIDDDKKAAAAFLKAPSAIYAGPLWRHLWDEALGNSLGG